MNRIKVGIIEDEPLVMENLVVFLEGMPHFDLMFNCTSMEDCLDLPISYLEIDVLLLDIGLPGMTGIDGLPRIHKINEDIDVIMLTSFEDSEMIFRALRAGAVGYISKKSSLKQIKMAIETIYNGGSYMSPSVARKVIGYFSPPPQPKREKAVLTNRQMQIVESLADGLSYKKIAQKLQISVETVRDHIKKIYKRLEVNSKAEVISKKLRGEI
jgi:DNA-binding NarL/FixJ family response regulator